MASNVCNEISLALKLNSDILSIRIGTNSLRTLFIIYGDTSVPHTGGDSAVVNIFNPK